MDITPRLGENESMPQRLLLPLSLVLACGPGSSGTEAGTTTAASSTSTGEPSTGAAETTQVATTGPTSGPTTGPVTTGSTTDTASTDITTSSTGITTTSTGITTSSTGITTTSTGTTGDTGTTGTTGEDMVEYAAFFGAGGLDHLLIHRADFLNDRCTSIHFAWPVDPMPEFAITAPNGWNFVNAFVGAGTDGCLAGMPMADPVVGAIAGAGAGTWQQEPDMYCPLTLDLDVTLDFPPDQPWVPAQEQMLVTALPVQSCP